MGATGTRWPWIASMSEYSALAPFYDGLFDPAYRAAIAREYRAALHALGLEKGEILDFGCGTGEMSTVLLRAGASVTGLDPDPAMLAVAKERLGDRARLILGSAESIPSRRFDAAVSSLDVINHIINPSALQSAFVAIRRAVRKGGVFLFDVNTRKKFKSIYGNQSYVIESESAFCAWQNDWNPKTDTVRFTIDVFSCEGESYRRCRNSFCERWYSTQFLKKSLQKAGFSQIFTRSLDDDTRLLLLTR